MEAPTFMSLCLTAGIDYSNFQVRLEDIGLFALFQKLPTSLYNAANAHLEFNSGQFDFKSAVQTFLDKVNDKMTQVPNGIQKAQLKADIQAFSFSLVQALKKDFAKSIGNIDKEIGDGIEQYANTRYIDKADLFEHTSRFIVEKPTKVTGVVTKTSTKGFRCHLAPETLENLNLIVCKEYKVTKGVADLRGIFGDGTKLTKPCNLNDGKLFVFIGLLHYLWGLKLIYPNNNLFWETVAESVIDTRDKFSSDYLRRKFNTIQKKPTEKYRIITQEVEFLKKEVDKLRQTCDISATSRTRR